jgi:murein DD-endopeptidase MepM/ murein hydrolase activator NlpD
MKRQFRLSPFKYGYRITSRFSYRRLHPVRKVYRPHYGVDFGAPVGTPVIATADGTVTFVGRNGAAGRQVTLRHKNRYETLYLHLSRYAVKRGDRVKEGEVIGYVGSSGESTGPHLDYRIKENGRYINPLSYKFKPVEPLRNEYRVNFDQVAALNLWLLDAPIHLVFQMTGATPWPDDAIKTADSD